MSAITSNGAKVTADILKRILLQTIAFNNTMGAKGAHKRKLTLCVWGNPGIGKTSIVKQLVNKDTKVVDIPLAQFEEMGDLHGMPRKVPDAKDGERTVYAPPHWVPNEEGDKSYVILLDDWNRADIRIIKGTMQLLQNYGTVSWQFPPRTTIVLTGNIDDGEQLVTGVDSAIMTRIRHVELEADPLIWAEWARASEEVDNRVITFVLRHKEQFCPKTPNCRTNPRTLTEFGEFLQHSPNLKETDIKIHARAALDDATANLFDKFIKDELSMLIDPKDILEGNWKPTTIAQLAKDNKTDVIYTMVDRLYVEVCSTRYTKSRHENFENFITQTGIPKDMTMAVISRMVNQDNKQDWCKGTKLSKLAIELFANQ